MFLNLILAFIPVWAATAEPISLSRYIATEVCDRQGNCTKKAEKNLENPKVTLALSPYRKGKSIGWDGWHKNTLMVEGIRIRSEIHVIQYENPGKYKFFVYAMLKSGKREGKTKKLHLKNLEDLQELVIADDPIKTTKGTLRAKLVIGPIPH